MWLARVVSSLFIVQMLITEALVLMDFCRDVSGNTVFLFAQRFHPKFLQRSLVYMTIIEGLCYVNCTSDFQPTNFSQ